jgi:hypothetical protein
LRLRNFARAFASFANTFATSAIKFRFFNREELAKDAKGITRARQVAAHESPGVSLNAVDQRKLTALNGTKINRGGEKIVLKNFGASVIPVRESKHFQIRVSPTLRRVLRRTSPGT